MCPFTCFRAWCSTQPAAPPLPPAADRTHSWMRLDRTVVVPWTLLFVSIIKKHWHALPWPVLLKSFSCFIVIICPSYLQASCGRSGAQGSAAGAAECLCTNGPCPEPASAQQACLLQLHPAPAHAAPPARRPPALRRSWCWAVSATGATGC